MKKDTRYKLGKQPPVPLLLFDNIEIRPTVNDLPIFYKWKDLPNFLTTRNNLCLLIGSTRANLPTVGIKRTKKANKTRDYELVNFMHLFSDEQKEDARAISEFLTNPSRDNKELGKMLLRALNPEIQQLSNNKL